MPAKIRKAKMVRIQPAPIHFGVSFPPDCTLNPVYELLRGREAGGPVDRHVYTTPPFAVPVVLCCVTEQSGETIS
jgi:hypothetical protein